ILLLPSTKHVTVPNVAGQTEQAADALLRRAGLTPVSSLESSSLIAAGRVIRQTPSPGAVVDKGSRVQLFVSGGPAGPALTNVEGLTAAEATAKLRAAGFLPTTKHQASSTVAAGKVIGTEPPAGTETQLGSHVTVLVSSGPAPVRVPDVVGQSRSAAERTL